MKAKEGNGWIFGPNKVPKKGDALLWVVGSRVINGQWELQPAADNLTAYNSYTKSTLYNLGPAPGGHNYNDVLGKAEKILGIKR